VAEWPAGFMQVRIPGVWSAGVYGVVTFGAESSALGDASFNAELVWGAFNEHVLPLLDSTVEWGPVQVSIGPSSAPISGEGTSRAFGGSVIESCPPNCAVLVQKRTATGGRRGRGRYFWPWAASETSVSEGGVWATASRNNFQTGQEGFLAELTTNNVPMMLFHADGGAPSPVTSLVTQTLLATQRRRMRR
jgi:hypothetical protein